MKILDNVSLTEEEYAKKVKEARESGKTVKEVSTGVFKTLKKLRG